MKSKFLYLILFSSLFCFSSAFAISSTEPANKGQLLETVNGKITTANKDNEIIAWLIVLDKNEIAASTEALKRKLDPKAKQYALLLNKDHAKNLRETVKVSEKIGEKPVAVDEVVVFKQKGEQELSKMKGLNDQQFQITFIDTMANGHANAIKQIDQDLKVVTNPTLKRHLVMTRSAVANHLQKAKILQNQLRNGQ